MLLAVGAGGLWHLERSQFTSTLTGVRCPLMVLFGTRANGQTITAYIIMGLKRITEGNAFQKFPLLISVC